MRLTRKEFNRKLELVGFGVRTYGEEICDLMVAAGVEFKGVEPEAGKWYNLSCGMLIHVTSVDSLDVKYYGFRPDKRWYEGSRMDKGSVRYNSIISEATDEEVKEALVQESIKRGFRNVDTKLTNYCSSSYYEARRSISYDYVSIENEVCLQINGTFVFKDGKWAGIKKPQEEIVVGGITYIIKEK